MSSPVTKAISAMRGPKATSSAAPLPLLTPLSQPSVAAADGWLSGVSSGSGAALLVAFGPLIALIALVTGLLIHFGMPRVWKSAWPSLQVGGLLGACLA